MCGADENMAITAENRVKSYQVPSFILMGVTSLNESMLVVNRKTIM